jgi:membrane protein
MKKITPKGLLKVLKNAFIGFFENKVLKLSASLAYYTIFSLGPLLIVILYVCGKIFGREAVEGGIYGTIEDFVGNDTAIQLQEIIKNAAITGSGFSAIIGVITLLIGATTVFAEIQDSINMIWNLKPKPGKNTWWQLIKIRLLSFGVIGSLGFLLLVSLGISAIVESLNDRLKVQFPDVAVVFFYILNLVISFLVTTSLFAVIFKVLPDAKIKWRDVISGSIATALLFMLGKFAISYYISKTNIGSTYGAAGSLVVLMVWIYYSSTILYFGAEFTRAFAVNFGKSIYPNKYAIVATTVEVEQGHKTIQQADKESIQIKEDVKEQAADNAADVKR